jgi:hypothetical protein
LWADCLASFVVEVGSDRTPHGFVTLYRPDMANGTVYLAAARFGARRAFDTRMLGAIALLIDLRLSRVALPEDLYGGGGVQLQSVSGSHRYVVEEGRLKEHVSLDGVYWDLLLLALWRQSWDREGSHLRRHA